MNSGFKKPISLVFFGVFALSLAGFFTIMHVGMSSRRQAGGIVHGFGHRGPTGGAVEPGYAADFKRGTEIVADKASDFFSWADEAPAAAGVLTASARQAGGAGGAGEEAAAEESDPFEDFYKKNYGRSSAAAAPYGSGGGSVGSWSGSGDSMTSGGRAGAPAAAAGAGAGEDAAAPAAAGQPSGSAVPGAEALKAGAAAPGPQASLPKGGQPFQGLERAGELTGGKLSGGGSPGSPGSMGAGKLSGMPGQKVAADLNGADEKGRTAAAADFKALSGGKAAVAAGGRRHCQAARPYPRGRFLRLGRLLRFRGRGGHRFGRVLLARLRHQEHAFRKYRRFLYCLPLRRLNSLLAQAGGCAARLRGPGFFKDCGYGKAQGRRSRFCDGRGRGRRAREGATEVGSRNSGRAAG